MTATKTRKQKHLIVFQQTTIGNTINVLNNFNYDSELTSSSVPTQGSKFGLKSIQGHFARLVESDLPSDNLIGQSAASVTWHWFTEPVNLMRLIYR